MPQIEAFHGLRYDLGHVGSLSDVVAPPYDVIGTELQSDLYKKHPANVIRLILNRDEPGDDEANNRYSRAARFLKNWRSEGVLQVDSAASLYVYHQEFVVDGQTLTRRGFMCRVRLERFGEGSVYPHEETHAAAKADRLKLTTACRANLSPIFGLYPDDANEIQDALERAIVGAPPLMATDHLGVVHRMWPVTDVRAISQATALMGQRPMFVADGHHRYETACNYRDQLSAAGPLPADHPANFVLSMCVGMSDPGMVVLPTHRLFRGLAAMSSADLIARLGDCFSTRILGEGTDLAGTVWEEIETGGDQGALGFYTDQDQRWVLATITPAGRRRMSQVAADHGAEWQGLGVSILERLVLHTLLEAKDLPKPMYVHSVDEVIHSLDQGDVAGRDATGQMGTGGAFNLATLVMPATLEHIRSISQLGERMPAKSTYFYPKLLSGLVFHLLE